MKLLPRAVIWRLPCTAAIVLFAISCSSAEQRLPAGIRIPVILTKSISTKISVGAPVEAETTAQVKLPGSFGVIPKGSRVTGRVSLVAPYNKKESRLSLVLERIETKADVYSMRAFIVGKLRARNSELGVGPSAIYQVRNTPPEGYIPVNQQIPIDSNCRLEKSENPDVGSEVVSKRSNVALDFGSTFDVLTVQN